MRNVEIDGWLQYSKHFINKPIKPVMISVVTWQNGWMEDAHPPRYGRHFCARKLPETWDAAFPNWSPTTQKYEHSMVYGCFKKTRKKATWLLVNRAVHLTVHNVHGMYTVEAVCLDTCASLKTCFLCVKPEPLIVHNSFPPYPQCPSHTKCC